MLTNLMIRLNEEASKFKKIYFPKYGGAFGNFNEVMNNIFIEHCKKLNTIEYWENEKKESKESMEQKKLSMENCDIRIKNILNKEYSILTKSWETICKKPKVKEFILETINLMKKEEFDIEARLRVFNERFKQKTSKEFFNKLIKFVTEISLEERETESKK